MQRQTKTQKKKKTRKWQQKKNQNRVGAKHSSSKQTENGEKGVPVMSFFRDTYDSEQKTKTNHPLTTSSSSSLFLWKLLSLTIKHSTHPIITTTTVDHSNQSMATISIRRRISFTRIRSIMLRWIRILQRLITFPSSQSSSRPSTKTSLDNKS